MIGKQGFSLVEVIIASAVLTLLIGAFGSGIVYTQTRGAMSGDRIRAVLLAEEGMEAVRNIRDDDFSLLTDGQHGLSFVPTADTGAVNCGTAVSVAAPGGPWSSPQDACGSNNVYASRSISPGTETPYLKATNFGFTVPPTATITGIVANIERKSSLSSCVKDSKVRIVKNDQIKTQEKKQSVSWPTGGAAGDQVATYGGSTDVWGETWTPADINAPDFGLAIAVLNESGICGAVPVASVDTMQIVVYYTVPDFVWQFFQTSDTTGIYTRTVSIASPDANTKRVTSTVTWMQNSFVPGKVELVGEFTNWQTPAVGNWGAPLEDGFYNLNGAGPVTKLAMQGTLAYAVRRSGNPNFAILDVANPTAPQLTGSLAGSPPYGSLRGISLNGNYAYIISSDASRELQVVNVTNPFAPSFVPPAVNLPGNNIVNGIAVSGDYLYITRNVGSAHEFLVYNISVPTSPSFVTSFNSVSSLTDLLIIGSYAYVATTHPSQELIVVNIANPAAPTVASTLDLPMSSGASAIAAYGTTLIMGGGYYIEFVNIADPLTPVAQGYVYIGSAGVSGLSVGPNNNFVFAATGNAAGEFVVVKACNPEAPGVAGYLNTSAALNSVVYSTLLNRAIVGTSDNAKEFLTIKPQ